jgi:hypothetical protein
MGFGHFQVAHKVPTLLPGNVKAEVWNACAAGIFFLVADGNLGILSCLWSLVVRGSAI